MMMDASENDGIIRRWILGSVLMAGMVSLTNVPGCGQMTLQQDHVIQDSVYLQSIRSVLLSPLSWELAPPVIELHTEQQLELLFDDLSDEQRDFSYALLHCDSEWRPTDIPWQQYLQGFNEGEIRELRRSFGTTRDYVNYRLVFPEELMMPVQAGNYAIMVYERGRPDQIVLTRRFYVLDRQVGVEGQVRRAGSGGHTDDGQQIVVAVTDPEGRIRDPRTELDVVVVQNGRADRTRHAQAPLFISAGRFDYSFPDKFLFHGGNEFRSFDSKSMKYLSERISRIEFKNPYYHVWLKPDESRQFSPYFYKADLNGAFYVDRENAVDKHQEADYVYVHFRLEPAFPPGDEQLYVFGMLSEWGLNESSKMTYNSEGYYELTMLLKQGLYDYMYVAERPGQSPDEGMYEGSHGETENTYTLLVYLHNMKERMDQLIGFGSLKSP